MPSERIATIINKIHTLLKDTSIEVKVKTDISKLLTLREAEVSKHEDECLQLYTLIDNLVDKLTDKERVCTKQEVIIKSLESAANQKASEVAVFQNELDNLQKSHQKELIRRSELLQNAKDQNTKLFTAIGTIESNLSQLYTSAQKKNDYKKFAQKANSIVTSMIKVCTPTK